MHCPRYAYAPSSKTLVAAYGKWMEQLEREDFSPYLLSFMFRHIPGSSLLVEKAMRDAVERVYSLSLTHLIRHPHSAASRNLLPIWIGLPDYPVWKGTPTSLRDVSVNAGLHVHVTAMIHRESRLKIPFHLHLRERSDLYVCAPLYRLHAEPIRDRLAYVSEYSQKQLSRGRATSDDLIILPRTSSEMGQVVGRRCRWLFEDHLSRSDTPHSPPPIGGVRVDHDELIRSYSQSQRDKSEASSIVR